MQIKDLASQRGPNLPKDRGSRAKRAAPDGGVLYVLRESDGFRCLYGLRLDPRTGRDRGEPFLVAHIHNATLRSGSTGLGSAVATGLFVADLYETRGNIWTAQLVRGGNRTVGNIRGGAR